MSLFPPPSSCSVPLCTCQVLPHFISYLFALQPSPARFADLEAYGAGFIAREHAFADRGRDKNAARTRVKYTCPMHAVALPPRGPEGPSHEPGKRRTCHQNNQKNAPLRQRTPQRTDFARPLQIPFSGHTTEEKALKTRAGPETRRAAKGLPKDFRPPPFPIIYSDFVGVLWIRAVGV